MKCNLGITIPTLPTDPCNGEEMATDCVKYEDAITYLSLPPNSTVTEIVDALLASLSDARSRVVLLESEMLLKAEDDDVLHKTGTETKTGRLIINANGTGNDGLVVVADGGSGVVAISNEATQAGLFAQNTSTGDAAVFLGANGQAKVDTDGNAIAQNFRAEAIVEYADNAAALLGGLIIGDFYRTGDLLKVVH